MILRRMMTSGLVLGGFLAMAPSVSADWSDAVFPVKSHNFQTVAVGAKTEFRFPVKNNLPQKQTLHLRDVRTSCGCTTAIIETPYIQPGETGWILARFNTPTFRGQKGATLTVIIDQPFYTEVRLRVDGYIRSDMVFHPGSIDLGTIDQGDAKVGSTTLYYAGRSDWQVMSVRGNQPWMVPSFEQVERGPGKAQYAISVNIREDAPVGQFQNEIIIQTNDRSMPNVPLRVTGNVETALAISPQSIALGPVQAKQAMTQRLIIKGREPFAIESIQCEGWKVDFAQETEPKKLHMVNVTLTPDTAKGTQRVPIVIKTSGENSVTAKAILTADVLVQQVAKAE